MGPNKIDLKAADIESELGLEYNNNKSSVSNFEEIKEVNSTEIDTKYIKKNKSRAGIKLNCFNSKEKSTSEDEKKTDDESKTKDDEPNHLGNKDFENGKSCNFTDETTESEKSIKEEKPPKDLEVGDKKNVVKKGKFSLNCLKGADKEDDGDDTENENSENKDKKNEESINDTQSNIKEGENNKNESENSLKSANNENYDSNTNDKNESENSLKSENNENDKPDTNDKNKKSKI